VSLKGELPKVIGHDSIDRAMLAGPVCCRTFYCDIEPTTALQ
jgi:hypothetical protein